MDLSSQSVGPKIAWLARHEPEVVARTAIWHTATSFIVARLTGVAAIDHHQASYFGPVIDARARAWDLGPARAHAPALADAVDGRLPPLRWPGAVAGPVTAEAAAATGLPVGTPVLVGTSDGPTEALGVGATRPGIVALTLGSTTTLTTFGDPADGRRRRAVAERGLVADRALPGRRAAGRRGGPGVAGPDARAWTWPRPTRRPPPSAPGAQGVLVLPYLAGIRTPVADPVAPGCRRRPQPGHDAGRSRARRPRGAGLRRAPRPRCVRGGGRPRSSAIRAAGGGTRSRLAVQTLADVLDRPIEVASQTAGAAYGAAYLAARSVGALAPGVAARAPDGWFRAAATVRPDPTAVAVHAGGFTRFERLLRRHGGAGREGGRAPRPGRPARRRGGRAGPARRAASSSVRRSPGSAAPTPGRWRHGSPRLRGPQVLGHEFAGMISASDVPRAAGGHGRGGLPRRTVPALPGMRASGRPTCAATRRVLGYDLPGGMAEAVAVPAELDPDGWCRAPGPRPVAGPGRHRRAIAHGHQRAGPGPCRAWGCGPRAGPRPHRRAPRRDRPRRAAPPSVVGTDPDPDRLAAAAAILGIDAVAEPAAASTLRADGRWRGAHRRRASRLRRGHRGHRRATGPGQRPRAGRAGWPDPGLRRPAAATTGSWTWT